MRRNRRCIFLGTKPPTQWSKILTLLESGEKTGTEVNKYLAGM